MHLCTLVIQTGMQGMKAFRLVVQQQRKLFLISFQQLKRRTITRAAASGSQESQIEEKKKRLFQLREKESWGQFHHHFTHSFYGRRSQKCKKGSQVKQLFALLGSAGLKAARKHIDEIDPWGQFHQPIGAKRKCTSTKNFSQPVSPTKLHPTLPVHRTRSFTQLLHSTLNAICQ